MIGVVLSMICVFDMIIFVVSQILENVVFIIIKEEFKMKINKLCYSQKPRLILSNYPDHQTGGNQAPSNLNGDYIFNSRSKGVSLKSPLAKQKQNNRILIKQTQSGQIPKGNASKTIRLRSFSTTGSQPKLNALGASKKQNQAVKPKQIKETPKFNTIQEHIHNLIEILKKNFVLNQNHIISYTIKKEHFLNLMHHILVPTNNTHEKSKSRVVDGTGLSFLNETLQQIWQARKKIDLQENCQNSKLISKIISYRYSKDNYDVQINKEKTELQLLLNKKKTVSQEVDTLTRTKDQFTKQCKSKQQELSSQLQTITENSMKLESLKSNIEASSKQLELIENLLSKNKTESQNIYNYVSIQQINKHIQLAAEDYKNIEADIYQYASHLQCNQLASSLTYQPLTITCITEDLQNQIRNINTTLIQNDQLSAKQKSKRMRDFVLQWMQRFKRKDKEQQNLLQFKTKCVIQFIEKMKKWLDNWTLKQEYLVNLRNQFAFESPKMIAMIEALAEGTANKQMMDLYLKLEKNYKLGNSFY